MQKQPVQRTDTRTNHNAGRMARLCWSAAAAVLLAGASVMAQTAPVEPYWAAITEDGTMMRSGFRDSVEYYPVAKLAKGALVRVDGESREWLQVQYTASTPAYLPFDSAAPDLTSKTVTITKASRLSAANLTDGFKGSWRPLLAQPLEAGTKLTLLELTPSESNRGKAWKVAAPEGARGFIPTNTVRRATSTEISAHARELESAPPVTTHAPVQTPVQPKTEPVVEPAPKQPDASTAIPSGSPLEIDLRNREQSGTIPAQPEPTPVTNPATTQDSNTPASNNNSSNSGSADPAATNTPSGSTPGMTPSNSHRAERAGANNPVASATNVKPRMNKYDGLESAFNAVRQQGTDEAELNELVAEYEKAIGEVPPEKPRLKAQLQQRVEILKIRAELQAQRRKMQDDHQAVKTEKAVVEAKLADFEKARQYVVVGRLSASTIYDGQRLPLMYRIQSIGGLTNGRTLAYVKPQDGVSPDRFLGAIVGVVGETNLDPELKLNIVTPARIDALEALGNGGVAITPPADPSATPPATDPNATPPATSEQATVPNDTPADQPR